APLGSTAQFSHTGIGCVESTSRSARPTPLQRRRRPAKRGRRPRSFHHPPFARNSADAHYSADERMVVGLGCGIDEEDQRPCPRLRNGGTITHAASCAVVRPTGKADR